MILIFWKSTGICYNVFSSNKYYNFFLFLSICVIFVLFLFVSLDGDGDGDGDVTRYLWLSHNKNISEAVYIQSLNQFH
jgi:hypothetical protein